MHSYKFILIVCLFIYLLSIIYYLFKGDSILAFKGFTVTLKCIITTPEQGVIEIKSLCMKSMLCCHLSIILRHPKQMIHFEMHYHNNQAGCHRDKKSMYEKYSVLSPQ